MTQTLKNIAAYGVYVLLLYVMLRLIYSMGYLLVLNFSMR